VHSRRWWLNLVDNGPATPREAAEFLPNRPLPERILPWYYHRRADEMRLAAREVRSSDNRDTLRSFASYFDRLADEAGRAEQTQPAKAAAC
jgi:hypothetical protein